jgi:hypothetical protein
VAGEDNGDDHDLAAGSRPDEPDQHRAVASGPAPADIPLAAVTGCREDYGMSPDRAGLQGIATECATLVARQFGRHLDWSLASLDELDAVCADLLADGPLDARRLELWWKLTGAYTGEVLVRVYGGQRIMHEQAPGSFAVSVHGMTAFPFPITDKIPRRAVQEPPSFARAPRSRCTRSGRPARRTTCARRMTS